MMENKVVIDTNISIYHLSGDHALEATLTGKSIYISFVSEIELRCKPHLTKTEEAVIDQYLKCATVVHSNSAICRLAAQVKIENRALKIADSIIAATSLYLSLPLLTADKLLLKAKGVDTIPYLPSVK